ncbi:cohesin loading factor [Dipodascopsis uninucleata]
MNPQPMGIGDGSLNRADYPTINYDVPQTQIQIPPFTADQSIHKIMFPLAKEYLTTARSRSGSLNTVEEVACYYKLISLAIRCLEVVLQSRVPLYVECLAAMWYAEILFTENINLAAAEEALNKGIQVANRNNLHDPKFTMLQLLVRTMAKSNEKVAQKLLTTCIRDAESYPAPNWLYSFQFLKVQLFLGSEDYGNAISCLKPFFGCISSELRYLAFDLCALASLQQNNPEKAKNYLDRALQCETDYSRQYVPQLVLMRIYFNVLISVQEGNMPEAEQKLKVIHQWLDSHVVDESGKWPHWRDDGGFLIALPPSADGSKFIPINFTWWCQSEVYIMSYLLSGVVSLYGSYEKRKALRYLSEGIRVIESDLENGMSQGACLPLPAFIRRRRFYTLVKNVILIYMTFERFIRSEWSLDLLQSLHESLRSSECDGLLPLMYPIVIYLSGLYFQATGKLSSAMEAYNLLRQILPSNHELYILATLSMVLVYKGDAISDQNRAKALVEEVSNQAKDNPNKSVQFCQRLINLIDGSHSGIEVQNEISELIIIARDLANAQFTTIILFLGAMQFSDEKQQESTALASFLNAKRTRDVLWCWMAGNLSSDILQKSGKSLMAEKQIAVINQIKPLVDTLLNTSHSI